MRAAGYGLPAIPIIALAAATGSAGEPRIAAWNLEHLADADGEECVGRKAADYAVLARRIAGLDADVVAFQEVGSRPPSASPVPPVQQGVELLDDPVVVRRVAENGDVPAQLDLDRHRSSSPGVIAVAPATGPSSGGSGP